MAKVRVAMWSGPRNISTALMRSWENRGDTFVVDEPFYAHYLIQTGLDHPGRDDVIASQENDWRRVADWLTGNNPEGKAVFYQKHMAHHLLPNMSREWMAGVTNALLIRDPHEMLTSLTRIIPSPTVADTGLPQQVEILGYLRRETGSIPAVLDARDILENPVPMLAALCDRVGVAFSKRMLEWPAGPRSSDGVWAKHWYAAVEKSTRFEPYRTKHDKVPAHLDGVYAECKSLYEELHQHRLTA